ncbi:unnamed protein product [Blepharisma stoltei]|uniref:Uncharacterized protein n=1 Tax=Blepharisma stoltei TaxID=1481888 RepID=A0AAU9IM47_9CILI|nr:unnamed protein product [Blepharisma stoltei]
MEEDFTIEPWNDTIKLITNPKSHRPKISSKSFISNRKISLSPVCARTFKHNSSNKISDSYMCKDSKPTFPCPKYNINHSFTSRKNEQSKAFPKRNDISAMKSLLEYKKLIRSIDSGISGDPFLWSNNIYGIERLQHLFPLKVSSQPKFKSTNSMEVQKLDFLIPGISSRSLVPGHKTRSSSSFRAAKVKKC